MSIRVHKAVGYAVKGFTPSPSFLERYRECEVTLKNFSKWVIQNETRLQKFAENDPTRGRSILLEIDALSLSKKTFSGDYLTRSIVYDDEFGIDDVLFCIPPNFMSDWFRWDSTLDYAEETQFHGTRNRYEPLTRELYPYAKGMPPLMVAAQLMYFGIEDLWPQLHEALYVWWG